MSTNDQARKFSYVRSLRFTPVRLLLTAVFLASLLGFDTVESMGPEQVNSSTVTCDSGSFTPRVGISLEVANLELKEASSQESSTTQAVGPCFEWEYINGEWTLVIIECPY